MRAFHHAHDRQMTATLSVIVNGHKLITVTDVYDHDARLRSLELTAACI